VKTTPIHEGWLSLEQMMLKRHGEAAWRILGQGMQAAFYMGAMACHQSEGTEAEKFAQIETGMQDALGSPRMRLVKQ